MPDVLRGRVIDIVDGDTFDLEIVEIFSDNRDQYNQIERIRVASLSDEIESRTTDLEEYAGTDDEETTGTPEEASIETGRVDTTRFYEVRTKEDLEIRAEGKEVDCLVRERNGAGELECEVTVL